MTYEFGDRHIPARKTVRPTSQYSYRNNVHELSIVLNNPIPATTKILKECVVKVALYAEEDVIFFLYSFEGEIGWTETTFSFHHAPSDVRVPPSDPSSLLPVERDRVEIVFVNGRTNTIVGSKSAMFSHPFTVRLRNALITQAARKWPGQAMWDRQVRQIYAHYTTTKSMLLDCDAQCTLEGLQTRWT